LGNSAFLGAELPKGFKNQIDYIISLRVLSPCAYRGFNHFHARSMWVVGCVPTGVLNRLTRKTAHKEPFLRYNKAYIDNDVESQLCEEK
jgi:hypothetical protein